MININSFLQKAFDSGSIILPLSSISYQLVKVAKSHSYVESRGEQFLMDYSKWWIDFNKNLLDSLDSTTERILEGVLPELTLTSLQEKGYIKPDSYAKRLSSFSQVVTNH